MTAEHHEHHHHHQPEHVRHHQSTPQPSHTSSRIIEPKPCDHDTASPRTFTFPRSQEKLRAVLTTIADTIAADPPRYHITADHAQQLVARASAFDEALMRSSGSGTACPQATQHKNDARMAALAIFRPVMQQIRADTSIAISDKYDLGFQQARPRTQPVEAPISAPMLSLTLAGDGSHTLRAADERTPFRKRKPDGAAAIDLRILITSDGSTCADPNQVTTNTIVRTQRVTRTSKFIIEHDPAQAGRMATYFGRWSTRSGKTGPWSLPVSLTIAVMQMPGRE